MKTIAITEPGAPPTLVDLPDPSPAEGEVLVRIQASSINGFDLSVAHGRLAGMMEHRYPVVLGKDFWVCDSFQGLPPPDDDYPADRGDPHHTFPQLAVPLAEVQPTSRYDLDHRAKFVIGFFRHSLPGGKLSVLRLDADMYSGTIEALNALYPLLEPGGWLILDDVIVDWTPDDGKPQRGCDQAVWDYRAAHGITVPYDPAGTAAAWIKP